jgi:hypothetical protein
MSGVAAWPPHPATQTQVLPFRITHLPHHTQICGQSSMFPCAACYNPAGLAAGKSMHSRRNRPSRCSEPTTHAPSPHPPSTPGWRLTHLQLPGVQQRLQVRDGAKLGMGLVVRVHKVLYLGLHSTTNTDGCTRGHEQRNPACTCNTLGGCTVNAPQQLRNAAAV